MPCARHHASWRVSRSNSARASGSSARNTTSGARCGIPSAARTGASSPDWRSTSSGARRRGSPYNNAPASRAACSASSLERRSDSRWRRASVVASVNAASIAASAVKRVAVASASAGVEPAARTNVHRHCSPASSVTVRRLANTGSRTLPTVPESGRGEVTAAGRLHVRPRPRKRARSVSCSAAPGPTKRWATAGWDSPCPRGRRLAMSAPVGSSSAVCTNSLENAGCEASATGSCSTSSTQPVTSIVRVRSVRFVTVSERSSASASPATQTSRRVSMPWSRCAHANTPGALKTWPLREPCTGRAMPHVRPTAGSRNHMRQPSASLTRSAANRDNALPCQLERPMPASESHTE